MTQSTPHRVLIVRTDRIGDVVLTLPAVHAIKLHHPDWTIGLLVNETTAPLLEGLSFIDELLIDRRTGINRGLPGWMRTMGGLRRGRWEAAVNFHTKKRTNALLWAAGIPKRFGYKNNKWGWLLTTAFDDIRVMAGRHERDLCLDLIKQAGWIPAAHQPADPSLKPDPRLVEEVQEVLNKLSRGRPVFAVHPAASGPEKRWPLSNFLSVMKRLSAAHDPVWLILSAPKDASLTAALTAAGRDNDLAVYDWGGRTDLRRLTAVLACCRLLISNDSGPVHLAAAVSTAVVSVFTRNRPGVGPDRWAPLGRLSRAVAPFPQGDDRRPKPSAANIHLVPEVRPECVAACVDEVLKLCYD